MRLNLESGIRSKRSQVRSVVVRLGTSAAKTVNNRERIPDINVQHLVAIMLDREERFLPRGARSWRG